MTAPILYIQEVKQLSDLARVLTTTVVVTVILTLTLGLNLSRVALSTVERIICIDDASKEDSLLY